MITGEVAPVANNKQRNMAAERKTRRALGDIGNLVTLRGPDGKPLPQVSRPVTRGFCAQLLANAQAAAADNNKIGTKGAIVVDGALPERRAAAPKPPQKKASIKPKPEEMIEISKSVLYECQKTLENRR